MSVIQAIKTELDKLLQTGHKIIADSNNNTTTVELRIRYETWYTTGLAFVRQIIPERVSDFQSSYKREKRKVITAETYTIDDYLNGITVSLGDKLMFEPNSLFFTRLLSQLAILKAASDASDSLLRDVRTVLRAELFDDDLEAAKELLAKSHLRSAGVLCGVVLEGHLKSVIARRGITLTKRKPVLSDLNDALKAGSAYDTPTWRFIQRLADIRNLCGHSDERDPTRTEVEELIDGVAKIIKEVF